MSAAQNKQQLQAIFDELAKGNGRPFTDAMAEDFSWHMTGSTAWSKSYIGKAAVRRDLLDPLMAQFLRPYRNIAQQFIAEDDYVAVRCRGEVTTTAGKPYHNSYCFIFKLRDGKLVELTEYLDTALVQSTLADPPA